MAKTIEERTFEERTFEERTFEVDGGRFAKVGKVIGDNNPIHTDRGIAVQAGFDDTPMQGVSLMRYFEYIAEVEGLPTDDYTVSFSGAVYPGGALTFKGEVGKKVANLSAWKDSKRVAKASFKLEPGTSSLSICGENEPFLYQLCQDQANLFNGLLDLPERGFPASYVGAMIPATLLEIVKRRTGEFSGVYRSSRLRTLGHLRPGNYKVQVFPSGDSRAMGEKVFYLVGAVCRINENIVLAAELGVIAEPGMILE